MMKIPSSLRPILRRAAVLIGGGVGAALVAVAFFTSLLTSLEVGG